MQRFLGVRAGRYVGRQQVLRVRNRRGPQPSQPATTQYRTPYPLRVRNGPEERREIWATYIARLREATGISRPELARRLGVDPATVWRWESRKQKPESPDIPQAIAELFGIEVNEVLAAAGLSVDGPEVPAEPAPAFDRVLERIRSDPTLDPATKVRFIDMVIERRLRRERDELEEVQQMIELFRRERGA